MTVIVPRGRWPGHLLLPRIVITCIACCLAAIHARGQDLAFTLDFEEGTLRGWNRTGNAFDHQPTLDDNPTARNRGPSRHQGRYWIGTFERYQGHEDQERGQVQGDEPLGTLTSAPFTIPAGRLSFLIGGGSGHETRVELQVLQGEEPPPGAEVFTDVYRPVLQTSARQNSETMRRESWDLRPYAGRRGRIRIVDASSGPWGHVNVDDFRFAPDGPERAIRAAISPTHLQKVRGETAHFRSESTDDVTARWTGPEGQEGTGREFDIETRALAPGRYEVVLVVTSGGQEARAVATLEILPPPPPHLRAVTLSAEPDDVETGERVVLTARHEPPLEGARYRFVLDGEPRPWTDASSTETSFSRPGNHRVSVIARIDDGPVVESVPIIVRVRSPAAIEATISPRYLRKVRGETAHFRSESTDDVTARWTGPEGQEGTGREFDVETRALAPGRYEVVLVVTSGGQEARAVATLEILPPSPPPPRAVTLSAEPDDVETGHRIVLTARLDPPWDGARYRFILDGGPQPWTDASSTEISFSRAGSHRVTVMARIDDGPVIESVPIIVSVRPDDKNDEIRVLLIAGIPGAIGLGYLLSRMVKGRARVRRPHVRPRKDAGTQHIEGDALAAPLLELRLRPVPDPGRQSIEVDGAVIVDERREHE